MFNNLPKGQRVIPNFPRFGLTQFAKRFPQQQKRICVEIDGEVEHPISLTDELDSLERVTQVSDFHCVTTWSSLRQEWGGYRFRDFYEKIIQPKVRPNRHASILILRAQDGARTSFLLEDALNDDVLLADSLNGKPLMLRHGGPLRLVAPRHYGYKSIKYLSKIEFCCSYENYRPTGFKFMDHPRARVEFEERGRWLPGWLLRYLYRPLIGPTVKLFDSALTEYELQRDKKTGE